MLGCQHLVRQTQGVLLQVSSQHVLFPSSSAMASYKVGCWLGPCFDQLQLLWYSQGWGARGASSGHHLWAGSPAVPSLACCSLLLVFPIVGKCVTVTEMMLWLSVWDPNRVRKKDQIFKRPLVVGASGLPSFVKRQFGHNFWKSSACSGLTGLSHLFSLEELIQGEEWTGRCSALGWSWCVLLKEQSGIL